MNDPNRRGSTVPMRKSGSAINRAGSMPRFTLDMPHCALRCSTMRPISEVGTRPWNFLSKYTLGVDTSVTLQTGESGEPGSKDDLIIDTVLEQIQAVGYDGVTLSATRRYRS